MITDVTIKNFQSFKNIKVKLPPFSVIVGPNNSGKTNFKNSLWFLRELARGQSVADSLSSACGSLINIFHQNATDSISTTIEIGVKIRLTIGQNGNPILFHYNIAASKKDNEYVVNSEKLSKREIGKDKRTLSILNNVNGQVRISIAGKTGKTLTRLDNKSSAISQLNDLKHHKLFILFRAFLSRMWFFDLDPVAMKESITTKDAKAGLYDPRGRNIAGTLYDIKKNSPDNFELIKENLRKIVKEIDFIDIKELPDEKLYLLFKEIGIKKAFSSYAVSDGILRVLGLITAILSPEPPSLIFLEEIDKGIHFRRIRDIVTLLQSKIGNSEKGLMQVILTTHNPYLVDLIEPEQLIIAERKEDETILVPLATLQQKIKLIKTFLKEGATLGDIWYRGSLGGTPSNE